MGQKGKWINERRLSKDKLSDPPGATRMGPPATPSHATNVASGMNPTPRAPMPTAWTGKARGAASRNPGRPDPYRIRIRPGGADGEPLGATRARFAEPTKWGRPNQTNLKGMGWGRASHNLLHAPWRGCVPSRGSEMPLSMAQGWQSIAGG